MQCNLELIPFPSKFSNFLCRHGFLDFYIIFISTSVCLNFVIRTFASMKNRDHDILPYYILNLHWNTQAQIFDDDGYMIVRFNNMQVNSSLSLIRLQLLNTCSLTPGIKTYFYENFITFKI